MLCILTIARSLLKITCELISIHIPERLKVFVYIAKYVENLFEVHFIDVRHSSIMKLINISVMYQIMHFEKYVWQTVYYTFTGPH